MKNVTQSTLLTSIERFYDAVPRAGAAAEPYGGLTLFVRQGPGWPLYARPTLGGPEPTVADVHQVRLRQRELGAPEAFEWVDETNPTLVGVAAAAGLLVRRHPMMVLDAFTPVAAPAGTAATPARPGRPEPGRRAGECPCGRHGGLLLPRHRGGRRRSGRARQAPRGVQRGRPRLRAGRTAFRPDRAGAAARRPGGGLFRRLPARRRRGGDRRRGHAALRAPPRPGRRAHLRAHPARAGPGRRAGDALGRRRGRGPDCTGGSVSAGSAPPASPSQPTRPDSTTSLRFDSTRDGRNRAAALGPPRSGGAALGRNGASRRCRASRPGRRRRGSRQTPRTAPG